MAYRWRIRHKLILGMTLIVLLMAFLVAGTLNGLASYKTAMQSIDLKLSELSKAGLVRDAIKVLGDPIAGPNQRQTLLYKIPPALETLAEYRKHLEELRGQRSDPNYGFVELDQILAIERELRDLEKSLSQATGVNVADPTTPLPDLLAPTGPTRKSIDGVIRTSGDVITNIYTGLHLKIRASKFDYQHAQAILFGAAGLSLVFMIGLLHFFYKSVIKPIRLLELNVNRVAKGDFEHRIEIKTGDEMQDFGDALSDMTTRLRDIYRNLEQQVNERSRQLVRSERLAGVGFLAAGVAHEINNPLASIAFCSEALERRVVELFDENHARDPQEREIIVKYLKMVQEEAFRCKEITQKLLAFSRGEKSKREKTDLTSLLQGVLDMVQHLPNSKERNLRFESKEPLEAWVNGQEIKQVFLNLAVNALESMDEGGTLNIEQRLERGMVELRFTDSGCGMTPEVLENIFEPFFTTKDMGKGTGLGLSISHRIVSQHGGEIEAKSAGQDRGSTFIVRLPTDPPADQGPDGTEGIDPEEEFLKLSAAKQAA